MVSLCFLILRVTLYEFLPVLNCLAVSFECDLGERWVEHFDHLSTGGSKLLKLSTFCRQCFAPFDRPRIILEPKECAIDPGSHGL